MGMADLFGGMLDGEGGFDMGALLGGAVQMQEQLRAAQEQAMDTVVLAQSGGGMVKIEVTGGLDFRSVTIDPEAVDPTDVDLLQDLVLAALHDAAFKIQELLDRGLGDGGLDIGAMLGGGLDLGALVAGTDDADPAAPLHP